MDIEYLAQIHKGLISERFPFMMLVLLLTEMPPAPERIARRKTIVYKSRVDPTIVKLTAEKMKGKLFVKFGFSKPKPEEVQVVSVDKYYEPYVLIDGKYSYDCYKKRVYTLDVDDKTEELTILNQTLKPESVVSPPEEPRKVVTLEVEERWSHEEMAYVILDKSGREISPDKVPSAPSEEHPQKILKDFGKKSGKVKISPRKGVEIVKSRIVKRPPGADRVENELFEVSEHVVIYSPIYEITFRNMKTGEEKIVKIDGVTAKIIP